MILRVMILFVTFIRYNQIPKLLLVAVEYLPANFTTACPESFTKIVMIVI